MDNFLKRLWKRKTPPNLYKESMMRGNLKYRYIKNLLDKILSNPLNTYKVNEDGSYTVYGNFVSVTLSPKTPLKEVLDILHKLEQNPIIS